MAYAAILLTALSVAATLVLSHRPDCRQVDDPQAEPDSAGGPLAGRRARAVDSVQAFMLSVHGLRRLALTYWAVSGTGLRLGLVRRVLRRRQLVSCVQFLREPGLA